jgi:hypothetical protein
VHHHWSAFEVDEDESAGLFKKKCSLPLPNTCDRDARGATPPHVAQMWLFEVGPDGLPINGGKRRSHFEEDLGIAPLTSHLLHDRLSGVPPRPTVGRARPVALQRDRTGSY